MSEMKIYSPEGLSNADAGITTLTPNPTLAGKRIAALDNGKAGANHLLTAMATRLAERSGATFVGLHRKGGAATPCEPDLLETLVREADIVLTGTAD